MSVRSRATGEALTMPADSMEEARAGDCQVIAQRPPIAQTCIPHRNLSHELVGFKFRQEGKILTEPTIIEGDDQSAYRVPVDPSRAQSKEAWEIKIRTC